MDEEQQEIENSATRIDIAFQVMVRELNFLGKYMNQNQVTMIKSILDSFLKVMGTLFTKISPTYRKNSTSTEVDDLLKELNIRGPK